jgi:hypothetical protein
MPKSLVTGGAGFIGAHVVNELILMGHEVVAFDDLSGGFDDYVNPKATFIKGSVVDHDLLKKLFNNHRFDYVFHLAAYAAEGLSHFIRRFNYSNNLIGSVNLINESVKHKIKCFVFTSSIAVSGSTLPSGETVTLSAGTATYIFYAPSAGTVTFTATEGSATDSTTKGTITGSVTVSNPGLDAATVAAEAAEAAAQDATDAALDATEAAQEAGALAQEAVDLVTALSAEVTKLIAGVRASITYLTKLVMKLAAK